MERRELLKQKLANSHLAVSIRVQIDPQQHTQIVEVLVRKELPLRDLMRQAVRRYAQPGMIESDFIFYGSAQHEVDLQKPLYLTDHTQVFSLLHKAHASAEVAVSAARALTPQFMIELIETRTQQRFIIQQLPALVGRVKRDTTYDLTVNLGDLEFGRTVSGKHARITRDEDYYYIENLTEDNRLVVENDQGVQNVRYLQPQVLQDGDIIHIGKITMRCVIRN